MRTLKEEAARWFAKMQHAGADDPVRSRFEAWLAQNPAHARAYAAFDELWSRFDSGAGLEALAAVLEQKRKTAASRKNTHRYLRRRKSKCDPD